MIEGRVQPIVGAMASVACGGELRRHMVWIGCRLVILCVAGVAIGWHRLKLAIGRALVTGIAIHCGMGSGQWEAIIVLLDLLNRNLPPAHRMARLAVRSQLPLVNISVAVLAALAHIGKYRLHVALRASHRLVHAAQRVASLIVVEFWNRADRLPSGCRVTVLTGSIQIAVGAMRTAVRLCASPCCGKRQYEYTN